MVVIKALRRYFALGLVIDAGVIERLLVVECSFG